MTCLKIAFQKSGRLHVDSLQILKEADTPIDNGKSQWPKAVQQKK